MKIYQSIFIGFFVVASLACQSQQAQAVRNSAENNTNSMSNSLGNSDVSGEKENVDELVESFSDDTKIGVSGKNKIEIFNFKKAEGNVVQIKFYSLAENNEWKLKQNFEYEKDELTGCDPKISDFNNDGFKDVTYVSDVAARGANELRRLFIYDEKKDELIPIKNSEDYPSMLYNKKLNCVDAFLIHGTSTTVFLKIEGDMLKEFASVGNDGSVRTIYSIGKDGKKKFYEKTKSPKTTFTPDTKLLIRRAHIPPKI